MVSILKVNYSVVIIETFIKHSWFQLHTHSKGTKLFTKKKMSCGMK